MAKAVLVMDMPGSCFGCNFCHINSNGGEDRCQAFEVSRAVNSETYEKPDWCPLRELPEKIPEMESGDESRHRNIHARIKKQDEAPGVHIAEKYADRITRDFMKKSRV